MNDERMPGVNRPRRLITIVTQLTSRDIDTMLAATLFRIYYYFYGQLQSDEARR